MTKGKFLICTEAQVELFKKHNLVKEVDGKIISIEPCSYGAVILISKPLTTKSNKVVWSQEQQRFVVSNVW